MSLWFARESMDHGRWHDARRADLEQRDVSRLPYVRGRSIWGRWRRRARCGSAGCTIRGRCVAHGESGPRTPPTLAGAAPVRCRPSADRGTRGRCTSDRAVCRSTRRARKERNLSQRAELGTNPLLSEVASQGHVTSGGSSGVPLPRRGVAQPRRELFRALTPIPRASLGVRDLTDPLILAA